MGGAPLLLTLAAISIDYGVRPDGADGYQYVVQVDPSQLQQEIELESVVDPRVRGKVTSIVIRVSENPLPADVFDPNDLVADNGIRRAVALAEPVSTRETQSRKPQAGELPSTSPSAQSRASEPSSGSFSMPDTLAQQAQTGMAEAQARINEASNAVQDIQRGAANLRATVDQSLNQLRGGAPAADTSSQGQSPGQFAQPNSQNYANQGANGWGAGSQSAGASQSGAAARPGPGIANPDGSLTRAPNPHYQPQAWQSTDQSQQAQSHVTSAGQGQQPTTGYADRNTLPSYNQTSPSQPAGSSYQELIEYGRRLGREQALEDQRFASRTDVGLAGRNIATHPATMETTALNTSQPPAGTSASGTADRFGQQTAAAQSPTPSAGSGSVTTPLVDRLAMRDESSTGKSADDSLATRGRSEKSRAASELPQSYQPFSQRALNGMLLISIVLNAFLLINVGKLYNRHRDLVQSVRSTPTVSA